MCCFHALRYSTHDDYTSITDEWASVSCGHFKKTSVTEHAFVLTGSLKGALKRPAKLALFFQDEEHLRDLQRSDEDIEHFQSVNL